MLAKTQSLKKLDLFMHPPTLLRMTWWVSMTHQTTKQANKQANKPANKQTNIQLCAMMTHGEEAEKETQRRDEKIR